MEINGGTAQNKKPATHGCSPLGSSTTRSSEQLIVSVPGEFERIGRRRSAWCTKAELSDPADSETPRRLPMETMYYIGLDVHKRTISYCVKDGRGAIRDEGTTPATRFDLDRWMKTLPQ